MVAIDVASIFFLTLWQESWAFSGPTPSQQTMANTTAGTYWDTHWFSYCCRWDGFLILIRKPAFHEPGGLKSFNIIFSITILSSVRKLCSHPCYLMPSCSSALARALSFFSASVQKKKGAVQWNKLFFSAVQESMPSACIIAPVFNDVFISCLKITSVSGWTTRGYYYYLASHPHWA